MRFPLLGAAAIVATGLALPVLATSQTGPLVVSVTTSPNPFAVEGTTSVAKSTAVYGYASGTYATGVSGFAAPASGTLGNGVFGYSSNGIGVFGDSATANYPAVYGVNAGSGGLGVLGSSADGDGVAGMASAPGGYGVLGYASNSGDGVVGESTDANSTALRLIAIDGLAMTVEGPSFADVMSLDGSGNMILAGSLTQSGAPAATVRDRSGASRVMYAPRETQATVEDFGSGTMRAGAGYVALDPHFANIVDPAQRYLVFLTARGPNTGLYVTAQTARGFEVRDSTAHTTLDFDYRIVARALEPATARLPLAVPIRHTERVAHAPPRLPQSGGR